MVPTSTRICFFCRVKWPSNPPESTRCPSCGIEGAFTANLGDIGTAMLFEQMGVTQADFPDYKEQSP